MPQVERDSLDSVCGPGNDKNIVLVDEPDKRQSSSDDPPQSFWLSRDAVFDWFDRNTVVLDRKDSTKGKSNSNATPSHLLNSTSQRLPVKKSILALPKVKRSVSSDVKQKRIRTGLTLFPRRSTSTAAMTEPSSPKVSCMGRVRSKRDKNKTASASVRTEPEKIRKKNGFWKIIGSIFRSSKHATRPKDVPAGTAVPVHNNEPVSEPAGLMLTKRFVSGRKSDSWIGDLDLELPLPGKDTVKCGPVVLRQRSLGPLCELNCGPDISAAGPVKAVVTA